MASQREIAGGGGADEIPGHGPRYAPDQPLAPDQAGPADPARLARELTGRLPCARCGYDLRGLSVLELCPECGTPIRATILARVDPYAEVLRPLATPRLTAAGLLLCTAAALVAALLTWLLRGSDAYAALAAAPLITARAVAEAAALCIAVAGVSALAIVRPHRGIPAWQSIGASAGSGALLAAAALHWKLHGHFDLTHSRPYFLNDEVPAQRAWLRLGQAAMFLVAIAGLWPNIRLLTARSLVLRMGRAERQGVRAMIAALGLGALGDAVHVLAPTLGPGAQHIAATAATFLIAVGSMLFTLGLAGLFLDALRIAPVLIRPPLSIRQITTPRPVVPAPNRPGAAT